METLEKKVLKQVAERLKYYIEVKNISVKDLYDKSGISANNIYLLINNQARGVTLRTLVKIVDALDVQLVDLFVDQEIRIKLEESEYKYNQLKFEYTLLNLIVTNMVGKEAGSNSEESDQALEDFFIEGFGSLTNLREQSENVKRILDIARKYLKKKEVPKKET